MTKTLPAPAMPLGVKFDPNATLLENANAAWDHEREMQRRQNERNLKPASRRIFHRDEWEFTYYHAIDAVVPTFEVEGEVIAWCAASFHLVEFCSKCGKDWQLREFGSLATLGRRLEQRNEDEEFICRDCLMRKR